MNVNMSYIKVSGNEIKLEIAMDSTMSALDLAMTICAMLDGINKNNIPIVDDEKDGTLTV